MKVHLTSTPDYSKENIDIITAVLRAVPGEIQFIGGTPLTFDQICLKNERFHNPDLITSLSFDELYDIGKVYRAIHSISNDDFVVVLTSYRNNSDWFSGFSNRHIFVDIQGWEYFTEGDSKYGIAFQVVENIFQSLIELNIINVFAEPNIHHKSIGCINDMCTDKMEVVLKLRTGYICNSCLTYALQKGIDRSILFQIKSLILKIRDGLMGGLIVPDLKPEEISVYKKGVITIGNKKLNLAALPDSLFIFFLQNLEGIKAGTLDEHKDKLLEIYRKIRKAGAEESINKLCLHHDLPGSTFLKVKWFLNTNLINQVGKQISEFYLINNCRVGGKSIYKINIPPDYISIDPSF